MTDNKNLIEILNIEDNEVAVERQGINNCMVNLTQMAKPYGRGKQVSNWLHKKETREYLNFRASNSMPVEDKLLCASNSMHTFDDTYGGQIIIRKGNSSKFEQGTWCTDFHIALDFAAWLDPRKKDAVYDVFIKFLTGRNVGTLANTRLMPLPKFRDGFRKLETALRRYTSLDNLKSVAAKHGVTLDHVKDVLKGNKVSNPVLQSIIDAAKVNHDKGVTFPDWRIRGKGIDYNQSMIDFDPQAVVELDGREG